MKIRKIGIATPGGAGIISIFILAGLMFPCLLPAMDYNGRMIGSSPLRPVIMELNDFSLTELDLKTLEPLSESIIAKVPGDVFTALMDAGRIKDPYRDMNSKEVQWVDRRAWRYETAFDYEKKPGKRLHLLFMGVDYISRIELNGKTPVKRHEGMFSRIDLDITDALNPSGEQNLAVTLFGIPSKSLEFLGPSLGSSEFGRRHYLKTQMSFGWDFAPRLKGAGIWDRVYLYETGPVAIKDVFVKPHLDGRIEIEVELEGHPGVDAVVQVEIEGDNFSSDPLVHEQKITKTGTQFMTIKIPEIRRWWPWDMGEPNLYRVNARVKTDGADSDIASEVFGIREISWGPNPDAPEGSADWVLFINGKREFIRGANWVPAEAMAGRLDDKRYGDLIHMAKDMNANCLRMWGGGNRERRAFYDYCDRAGIMVWQEFPFACVYLAGYPKTKRFNSVVRQEADEMVRQLRNHASIIMWCGGNEFNVRQNKKVVSILAEVSAALDPTRRFVPASPYKGDSHNWVVWHMKGNLDDYFDDLSPVPSEFGLQAMPDTSLIKNWISPEYHWPIRETLHHHNIGLSKMNKYADAVGYEDNLESYTETSQLMQAHFLQRGIENWRQRKYKTSGTAFWQLNEPWPSICWSVIDYDLNPKLSYHVMTNTYNPVLVTARYDDRAWQAGDEFEATIMVVNDLHNKFDNVQIEATLCKDKMQQWTVDVPDDAVAVAGTFRARIPDNCDRPFFDLVLTHNHKKLSENHYEIWVHDPVPAGRINRGLVKISMWIMSGAVQKQWKEKKYF